MMRFHQNLLAESLEMHKQTACRWVVEPAGRPKATAATHFRRAGPPPRAEGRPPAGNTSRRRERRLTRLLAGASLNLILLRAPNRTSKRRSSPGITTIAAPNITTQRDEGRLLAGCQGVLGYEFRDPDLLREALTHASGADNRLASNERLEFLGDAILGAVVCESLFRKFPDYQEGELTRIKSVVVSRKTCAGSPRSWG